MELVSFSVTNYRSITKAYKLPIRRSTILIGPNNEGKSNILRALVTALEMLSRIGGYRIQRGRFRSSERFQKYYDWHCDFPISLQSKQSDGESVFNLEFELSDAEIAEFETEVRSKLNGTLPIELTLGQKAPGFKVLKKGPGGPALSKKAEQIAQFISKRINLGYIPAVRTATSAHEIVGELVERELAAVESDPVYQDALKAITGVQKPVLERISASIKETLKEFLPNVKEVQVSIPEEERFRALRRSCEILVDDGTATPLIRKGDGVQSLAALSLMRHASESTGAGRNLILAIEEPESHLHPSAIHQLKAVLTEIARKHQVIMTTHCPLFVDRTSIKSNILVHKNKATPAKDVRQIREILGVRASDNLQHAELILVVEGEEDRRALRALLKQHSKSLAAAIAEQALGIESLQGGTNLSYKLSQIREAMCAAHTFLDHDDCGLKSSQRAEQDGLLIIADVTFTTCNGMKESEIEDMFDEGLYSGMLQNRYGVSTQHPKFKGTAKWSDRLKDVFKHQGKPWSDLIESKVKADVAELVSANPATALNVHKRSSFDALITALETKLINIADSKL
jgi:predicted ATPase